MNKIHVELSYYSIKSRHNNMIVAGYMMLQKQGKIILDIIDKTNQYDSVPTPDICEVKINGCLLIAYDNADGYNFTAEELNKYLDKVDFYFKRSFSEKINKKYAIKNNIYPLGMNYYCTVKNNPLEDRSLKNRIKGIGRSIITRENDSPYIEKFEEVPTYNIKRKPKIIFSTRLWNPEDVYGSPRNNAIDRDKSFYKDPEEINNNRIEIIREAKKIYGDNFIGGIYDSDIARKLAPDIIYNRYATLRNNYIKMMKNSDICIASMGLSGSTGWKTAEYVAASKAIIAEKFVYTCPGDFYEGKNFLEFNDVNECLNKLEYLCNNPKEILKIQKNNFIYYQKYLRADMQAFNSMMFAIEKMNICL